MARILRADGTEETVQPKNKTNFRLQGEVYDLLNCRTVEMQHIVDTPDGNVMLLDEEGKLTGAELNAKATELWSKTHGIPFDNLVRSGDHIVGDVLICKDEEFR